MGRRRNSNSFNMFSSLIHNLKNANYSIIIASLLLTAMGLVNMFSVSYSQHADYFSKQAMWVGIGVIVFMLFASIDYRIFKNYPLFLVMLYVIALFLLGAVLVVGSRVNGSKSWFHFGPVAFEPVEMMKVIILMVWAKYFSQRHKEIFDFKNILISGVYMLLPVGLVMLQPDLGSALILVAAWLGITLFVGIKPRHLLIVLVSFLVVGVLGWHFFLHPYQKDRLLTFLHPQQDPLGAGYNITQALVAVGSGGVFGTGAGQGSQITMGFLPAAQSDFIFASLVEEWGMIGGVVVIGLFVYLIWQIASVALKAENNFARIFVSGVALLFFVQMFINIGMNIGILPITGIPLPFFSYGGSNLVTTFALLGLVESVAMRRSLG